MLLEHFEVRNLQMIVARRDAAMLQCSRQFTGSLPATVIALVASFEATRFDWTAVMLANVEWCSI